MARNIIICTSDFSLFGAIDILTSVALLEVSVKEIVEGIALFTIIGEFVTRLESIFTTL